MKFPITIRESSAVPPGTVYFMGADKQFPSLVEAVAYALTHPSQVVVMTNAEGARSIRNMLDGLSTQERS